MFLTLDGGSITNCNGKVQIKTRPRRDASSRCIFETSLIHYLRDISNRADLQISETYPERLIKDIFSEMSLRSLRFSQKRL